jgi:hypothetical protein
MLPLTLLRALLTALILFQNLCHCDTSSTKKRRSSLHHLSHFFLRFQPHPLTSSNSSDYTEEFDMHNDRPQDPPQPEYNVARNSINASVNKMEHGVNSPAIQYANQILATMARMEAALMEVRGTLNNTTTTVNHMDGRLAAVERIVGEWGPRTAASNHNNLAFVTNSLVRHRDTPVMAFQHAIINQAAPIFPPRLDTSRTCRPP